MLIGILVLRSWIIFFRYKWYKCFVQLTNWFQQAIHILKYTYPSINIGPSQPWDCSNPSTSHLACEHYFFTEGSSQICLKIMFFEQMQQSLKYILWRTTFKQESPPAWTQEAYRPPCSKYFLCCAILADPPPAGPDPPLPPQLDLTHPSPQLDLTPPPPAGPDPPLPPGWTWPTPPPRLDLTPPPPPAGPDPPLPPRLDLTHPSPLAGPDPPSPPLDLTHPSPPAGPDPAPAGPDPHLPPPAGPDPPLPPSWTWPPPPPRLDLTHPPSPPRCGLTNKVKLLPSRRTTYAGGNKLYTFDDSTQRSNAQDETNFNLSSTGEFHCNEPLHAELHKNKMK